MAQPLYPNAPKGEQHWFQYDTQSQSNKGPGTGRLRQTPRDELAKEETAGGRHGLHGSSGMRDAAQRHNINPYYGKCQCGITAVAYSHADLIKRLRMKHTSAKKREESG